MTLVDQSVSTGSNSAVKSLPGTASMRVFGRLRAVILLAGVVLTDLASLVMRLAESSADIALLAEPDGSPTGLMLVRCGTLRQISPIGFVDLNEQALPAIASKHVVRVVRNPVERYPVRNLA